MAKLDLPHDPLTPLDPSGPLTAQAVLQLRRELYANAEIVNTTLGGGAHGHLGLLMPPDEYQALSATPYFVPDAPPPEPLSLLSMARTLPWEHLLTPHRWLSWHWLRHDLWTHAHHWVTTTLDLTAPRLTRETWKEAQEFRRRMVSLIVAAVPSEYLEEFADRARGYGHAHPRDMLTSLIQSHGKITAADLKANYARLRAPWNPDTPITTLLHNATTCRHFASDGGEPIPDGVLIEAILTAIENSGVLSMAVYNWNRLPEDQHTVPRLYEFFKREDKFRHSEAGSVKASLTANAAAHTTTASPPSLKPPASKPYSQYCWTHGLTGHTSAECTRPLPGHVRTATMDNWTQHGGNWQMHRPHYYKQRIVLPDNTRPNKRRKTDGSPKDGSTAPSP
jgi:hypothetical protein